MKLKLDESGNVVLKDGLPVYVHEDGKEIAFDAPAAMAKISDLNGESAGHRRAAKAANEKLDVFGDMDPDAAIKALKTVQDLSDKKLIDAGEVDALKRSLGESFATKEESYTTALSAKDKTIRKLTVSTQFGQSEFLRSKTVLTPDIAESAFGKYFKLDDNNGTIKVVAELNGAPIFSRENPGEPAGFDEAMSVIIESRADKKSILRGTSSSGSGANGGGGGSPDVVDNPWKTGNRTQQSAIVRKDKSEARRMAIQAGANVPGLTD